MALDTGHSLYWKTGIDNQGLKKGSTEAKGILRTLSKSVTGMDIFAGLGISATIAFTKIIGFPAHFGKSNSCTYTQSCKYIHTCYILG